MTGVLALHGGAEHTPGCESLDRLLLDLTGRAVPVVTVVPAASSPRRRPLSASRAEAYWRRLGALVRIAPAGEPGEVRAALDVLDEADLVVLTGGHPERLHTSLAGSPIWRRIVRRWQAGVPLSGASSGAIAFCEWRQHLTWPSPLRMVHGFGLVPGCAVAPHYDLAPAHRWATLVARRHPDLVILGIDERTALVGRNGEFEVRGRGGVTVLHGGAAVRRTVGEAVRLETTAELAWSS